MQALSFGNTRSIIRPLVGCLAVFISLAVLSASMVGPTAASGTQDDAPQTPETVFVINANAGTLGDIPDSPSGGNLCGDYSSVPKDVTFTVSGAPTSAPSSIAVSMTLTHSFIGDLDVTLRAPGGTPFFTIYKQTLATTATACGSASNLAGAYNYADSAPPTPTWWNAVTAAGGTDGVAAPGNYRSTTPGGAAGGGVVTLITPAFAGVTNPNGTWTLRIHDGGQFDTGTVTAATLTLDVVGGGCATARRPLNFDGPLSGTSDFSVVRNTGGGPSGQATWFNHPNNGTYSGFQSMNWGITSDRLVPADYDGDGTTDIAVWREGAEAYFYILQSSTGTLRFDRFGQTGDDPSVVGDYDGDGKEDPAVYRGGAQSFFYYRSSSNGLIIGTPWGTTGDTPVPGDFDGDGKYDYVVRRNTGGSAVYHFNQSTSGQTSLAFGTPTDSIVPGFYDVDCRTDLAVTRGVGGERHWFILKSTDGTITSVSYGSATDLPVQGDYNGDGLTDIAVWRPVVGSTCLFFIRNTFDGSSRTFPWGVDGDRPAGNYNTH